MFIPREPYPDGTGVCCRPPRHVRFRHATTLPPKALRWITRKPAPGANPISHRRNRCRSSRSMPSTTTRMARRTVAQRHDGAALPRPTPHRVIEAASMRIIHVFTHSRKRSKAQECFSRNWNRTPNCWTSVSGMQSETAIWHASSRLWSTIPLSNAFANGASKSRTARPLPTMPRLIGCGNAADNATAEKRKPSAATLAAITVPAQAAPTRLPTIRWSSWNPAGRRTKQGYVQLRIRPAQRRHRPSRCSIQQIAITGRAKDGSIVFSQTQALNMAFPRSDCI